MVRGVPASLANTAKAAALLATASCYCGAPPEPVPEPQVASVEILPWSVTVVKDRVFTMRARVRDQWGNTLPDSRAEAVQWKTPDGYLGVPEVRSAAVTITAQPGGATLPLHTTLIAYVGAISRTAPITIVASRTPADPQLDWIASDYSPGDAPTIALVNGVAMQETPPAQRADTMIAFVREGALDAFDCPDGSNCGEVAIFSPQHAVAHTAVKWTSSCDFVGVTSAVSAPTGCGQVTQISGTLSPPQPQVVVPVFVWNASTTLTSDVNDDINYARTVFSNAWAGLSLDVKVNPPIAPRDISYNDEIGCYASGSDIPSLFPEIPIGAFQLGRITVIYVDDINPGDGTIAGFTCRYDYAGSKGTIIVLAGGRADGSSKLAHELGHALGQWRPPAPIHPDAWSPALTGLDPSNLMWSAEVDGGGGPRRFLTLGQLFQISFNKVSFMKAARLSSTPELTCASDPTSNSPCPPLVKDATK